MTTTENVLRKLDVTLSELTESGAERIIVSTHFVPEKQLIINTRYAKFARFNAYLGSQHFHEMFRKFPAVTDVVFGHMHHRIRPVSTDKITYHARPLGYTYEWQMLRNFLEKFPQYQLPESWRLRKQYKAVKDLSEWQDFRHAHLAEEFLSALTIFEF